MANSSWIVPAAVAVLVPLVMGVIGRRNSKRPEAIDGWVELRVPRFLPILGWISLVMATGFAIGTVNTLIDGDIKGGSVWGIVAMLFGWGAIWLILLGQNHRVAYSGTHLRITDESRRAQECAWSELSSGKVHSVSKLIHLKTTDGRVLKISGYLVGGDAFFAALAERTNLPVADLVKQARFPG